MSEKNYNKLSLNLSLPANIKSNTMSKSQLRRSSPLEYFLKQETRNLASDHQEMDVSQSVLDLELIATVYKESLRKFQVLRLVSAMGLSRLKQSVMYITSFHPDLHVGFTTNLSDINTTLRKTT